MSHWWQKVFLLGPQMSNFTRLQLSIPFWLKHILNASIFSDVFLNFEVFFFQPYTPSQSFLKTCRGRSWNRFASVWNMFDNLLYNLLYNTHYNTIQKVQLGFGIEICWITEKGRSFQFILQHIVVKYDKKLHSILKQVYFGKVFLWCEQDCGWLMARLKDHRGLLTWKPVNQDW